MSKETLSFVTPPPKNYKISSAFSYNFKLALTDYLPDGMSEICRENDPETHYQFVYFEDMEGRRISIERNIIIDNKWSTLILDTENAEVATVDLNGYEATLIVKGDHTTLMWEDAVSVMLVSGDFSPEEIFKVANGIHFTKK